MNPLWEPYKRGGTVPIGCVDCAHCARAFCGSEQTSSQAVKTAGQREKMMQPGWLDPGCCTTRVLEEEWHQDESA